MTKRVWLWLSLVLSILGLWCYYASFVSPDEIKKHTEVKLHGLEKKAEVYLDSIHKHLHSSPKRAFVNYLAGSYRNTFDEDGLAFFIYENDSLQYWSDNHVAVENYMLNVCLEKQLVKLKNGYYEVIRHPKNAYSTFQLYALVLIKNNFPYENRYLKNEFNKKLELPEGLTWSENEGVSAHRLQFANKANQVVFSLEASGQSRNSFFSLIAFLFLSSAAFLFLGRLRSFFLAEESVAGLIKWLVCVAFAGFLFWLVLCKFHVLYIPASVVFDGPGFLTGVLFLTWVLLLLWAFVVIRDFSISREPGLFYFSFLFLVTYLFGYGINACLNKILNKAYLSSDLSDVVFSSSAEIFLSYILIFVLLFCFVIFCETVFKRSHVLTKWHFIILVGFTAVGILANHLVGQYDILTAIWPGLFFILLLTAKKLCTNNRFLYGILTCLFLSFFAAYLSIDQKNRTDYEQRLNLAGQLASQRDQIAENLFGSVKDAIAKDKELVRIISKKDKSSGDVEQYVLRKYFTGYWDKYHISVCIFDSLCYPLVQHAQHLYNNNTYFDELMTSKLKPADGNLYFNEQVKDKTFYLFKAPLETFHKPHLLYLVIESKKTPEYRGFPDLLLNRSTLSANADYSFAVYKKGQIYNKQGRYEYPNFFSYPDDKQDNWMLQRNGYSHLVYKADPDTKIIVSKSYSYYNDLFSTIGFLFLASSTIFLLFSSVNSFIVKKENSLSVRIQHYAAVGIFILFIPVAISTIALVKKQTDQQNTDAIKEKTQTLANYLGVRLADYDTLTPAHKDYVTYLLAQASGLFKSDLTLFHTNGEYYSTSLPKLFDEGLISKKLNSSVYSTLLNANQSREVINESIGSLNFYSSYALVKNRSGHVLCLVNLPYFSRQSELQAQLFGYLSALLNIYILAFMIVSVTLALLANWLTRPLRQLQNQFMQIGLNRQDHSIKYDKNDEIGTLISAYNTMLVQLKQSAEKLAKSEREGAWKEMARQVAHEVKNPLTPMKLSLQHVERLMETNPGEAAAHIKRITPVLLEQIDALSHIATEFSNFWQLPSPKFENIELVEFVRSLVPLYNTNPAIAISFHTTESRVIVKADKDQLLRVMNNLINNAVQALYEEGKIVLSVYIKDGKAIISVYDSGTGIEEAAKEKIFQPNFSTKSYGTGLGLAMCKRIVEQHAGEIWFESEPGKGTTFYVSLNLS